QAFCAIHTFRRGTQAKWIWLIIFLPFIGSLIYIFSEMLHSNDIQNLGAGLGTVVNPGGRTRKLEENLRFSDTFNNRVMLADEYLRLGRVQKAVDLYESSMSGNFTENEHVMQQLIVCYSVLQHYDKVIVLARKLYQLPHFQRSKYHVLYAVALGYEGKKDEAEKQFLMMKARYSNYESRFEFGLFLQREGRHEEARQLFAGMLEDSVHLTPRERRHNSSWFSQAREQLRNNSKAVRP
ncbi:MAG: PLDc N-terminal domain-containing protein, partial [Gemmatimonadaceae bacterium]|nr:PLDc N-terminal domain-containing protein [Chitinophagaceae bacterium]